MSVIHTCINFLALSQQMTRNRVAFKKKEEEEHLFSHSSGSAGRTALPLKAPSSSFWQLLAPLVATLLQILPSSSQSLLLCVCIHLFLIKTLVIGLRAHLETLTLLHLQRHPFYSNSQVLATSL